MYRRDKVLSVFNTEDFDNKFLNVPIIGKPVDLFIECRYYETQIPVMGDIDSDLDIFEEAVLKIFIIKHCSISELADTLCLPKDLVHIIFDKLQEKGLIDSKRNVSDNGINEIMGLSETKKKENTVNGQLFMIRKNEMILPYIHIGEFEYQNTEYNWINNKGMYSEIEMYTGSAGNGRTIRGRVIRNSEKDKLPPQEISSFEALNVIRRYNKICSARNLPQVNLDSSYGIISNLSTDKVFIHMQAVVQQGNVDAIMISDGFVDNIDGLMDCIVSENPDVANYVKKHAVMIDTTKQDSSRKFYNGKKYRELIQIYQDTCEIIPEAKDSTVDQEKDDMINKKQVVSNCFFMIEWAFHYCIMKRRLSTEYMQLIECQTSSDNANTIARLAASEGFQSVQKSRRLFSNMNKSRINYEYREGTPNIYVCLPIAIAEASEDSESELHNLAQHDVNVLEFIMDLNEISKGFRHDSNSVLNGDVKKIFNRTKNIIKVLLPDIALEGNNERELNQSDSSARRLLGEVNLEKYLGSAYLAGMSSGLKDDWLRISPEKHGESLPPTKQYLEILYRILQVEIHNANEELENNKRLDKSAAIESVRRRYGKKLPESFVRIRPYFYEQATQGGNSTLGAEALVYIANVNEEKSKYLLKANYIDILDRVISLRQHNSVRFDVTESFLDELRNKVIEITKIIGE